LLLCVIVFVFVECVVCVICMILRRSVVVYVPCSECPFVGWW